MSNEVKEAETDDYMDKCIAIGDMDKDIKYYSLCIQSKKYRDLFSVQTHPEHKYILKGKEISVEKLVELLEKIDY